MQLKMADPELIDEILLRFSEGCTSVLMCDSIGINRSSYYKWMKCGELSDNEPFTSFRKAVMQAKSDYLRSRITEITISGKKQWQANAWLLERKLPEQFSEKYKKKEYPQRLNELPLEKRGDAIYDMMLKGEISQYEAHMFVEILAKMAAIEENVKLKAQLFEITEKMK